MQNDTPYDFLDFTASFKYVIYLFFLQNTLGEVGEFRNENFKSYFLCGHDFTSKMLHVPELQLKFIQSVHRYIHLQSQSESTVRIDRFVNTCDDHGVKRDSTG